MVPIKPINNGSRTGYMYGFDGEQTDVTGMIYLRARYYAPYLNRFTSRDQWAGDYKQPMSYNGWVFGYGNPVRYSDPSGYIPQTDATNADDIVNRLKTYLVFVRKDWGEKKWQQLVNWKIVSNCQWEDGKWDLKELETLEEAVKDLGAKVGGSSKFIQIFGNNTIIKKTTCGRGCTPDSLLPRIEFTDIGTVPTSVDVRNSSTTIDKWTVVHEFGHAWDRLFSHVPQRALEIFTNGHTDYIGSILLQINGTLQCDAQQKLSGCNNYGYFYGGVPPAGADENFNRAEDLAESVAAYVYPIEAQSSVQIYLNDPVHGNLYYSDYKTTPRYKFIDSRFKNPYP